MYQFHKTFVLLIIALIYIFPIESTHLQYRFNGTKESIKNELTENGKIAPGDVGYIGNIAGMLLTCFSDSSSYFLKNSPNAKLYADDLRSKLKGAFIAAETKLNKHSKNLAAMAKEHADDSAADFIYDYCVNLQSLVDDELATARKLIAKAEEDLEKEHAASADNSADDKISVEKDEKNGGDAGDSKNGKCMPSDNCKEAEKERVSGDITEKVEETGDMNEEIEKTLNDNLNTITNKEDSSSVEDEIINSEAEMKKEPAQNDGAEVFEDEIEDISQDERDAIKNLQEKLKDMSFGFNEKMSDGGYDEDTMKKLEDLMKLMQMGRDEL